MKAKDRKFSLKPDLKENENGSNFKSENFLSNLENIRHRLNILEKKQKTPVHFTYQETQPRTSRVSSKKEINQNEEKGKRLET